MIAPSEFQCYLKKICHRYEQWWTVDALTEIIADRQASFSFEQIVQTEEKKPGEKPQIVSLPILKGIQDYVESEHILLVGSPGVGKSTALLRCLVSFAKQELRKPEPRISVLVPLKRYNVDFSSAEDPSGILGLIKDTLEPELWLEISDIKRLLFQDKRLILILDGLNEMSAGTVRTELEEFRKKCERCNVPFICTAREGSGTLGIKRRLEIQSLNSSEIDRFLRECMPSQGQQVLQLLSRDNRDLSRTPFVLWMLYHLFQETGAVVETLGDAFRQFFRSFKKYKEDAPVTDERRKAWNPWLEDLAFTMLNSPEPNDPGLVISDERAEKVLAQRFGELHGASSRIEELLKYHLLERVSEKEVSFHHQLIQEYFAAERLLPKLARLSDDELKYYYLNYLKWTEPLAMAISFVDSEPLAVRMVTLALEVDLQLGARLAGEVKREFQEQTVGLVAAIEIPEELHLRIMGITCSEYAIPALSTALHHENSKINFYAAESLEKIGDEAAIENSKINFYAAESLGKIGGEAAISALRQAVLNREYSGNAIYALGRIGSEAAVSALLEALKHESSDVRRYAASALGETRNQRAMSPLLKALDDEDYSVRRYAASALGKIGSEEAVPALLEALEDEGFWVSQSAVYALGEIGSEKAVPTLMAALKNKILWSRKRAAYLLKEISSDEINGWLLQRLEDEYYSFVQAVSSALGKIDSKVTVPVLLKDLKHEDFLVRENATYVLAQIGSETILPALLEALKDENFRVRVESAHALGKIGNQTAVPLLLKALDDQNYLVRANVASALGEIGTEEVIPALLKVLKDEDSLVRANATYALGKIGNQATVPTLLAALEDQASSVRQSAIFGLERVGTEIAIAALGEALKKDENSWVRACAAESLGKIGTEAAIRGLLPALTDKDINPSVRRGAIRGLEKTRTEKAVTKLLEHFLLEYLADEDSYVRMDAAYVLGEIATSEILPSLTELLRKMEDTDLLDTISRIQSRCQFYNYDIAQLPPPQRTEDGKRRAEDFLHDKLNSLTQELKKVSEEPKRIINTQNYFEKGNHNHNHNYANNETLKQQIAEVRQLVHQLQQTHQPATEDQAVAIIDVEFSAIQQTNPTRWQKIKKQLQLLKRQLLNPERHLTASKAALGEVAKHYLEDSVFAKALITYVDAMSADTDQGE